LTALWGHFFMRKLLALAFLALALVGDVASVSTFTAQPAHACPSSERCAHR
jgi:hypothetical protein